MNSDIFVALALNYLGYPAIKYIRADQGIDTNEFDCSGFVAFILKQACYPDIIYRHCNEFFDYFGYTIHYNFRQPGDLVFFSYDGGISPSHIGILITHNDYIHSPGKDNRLIRVNKIEKILIEKNGNKGMQIYNYNPIGFKRIGIKNGRFHTNFLS